MAIMNSGSHVDVRCTRSLGVPSPESGRCQLLVGHEPPHALLFSCGKHRIVPSWYRHDVATAEDDCTEIARLPWARGYPVPAWIEPSNVGAG